MPDAANDAAVPSATAAGAERAQWKNRPLFLLASIGAAVGLGNLWRFPYLAFKHGGGAFLIPYLVALFLLGIPMLVLELSLGFVLRRGVVGALRRLHPRLVSLGVLQVLACCAIVSYYAAVLSWAVFYFVASFSSELPWTAPDVCGAVVNNSAVLVNNGVNGTLPLPPPAPYVRAPSEAPLPEEDPGYCAEQLALRGQSGSSLADCYFQNVVLQTAPNGETQGRLSGWLVLCLFVTWLLMFLSVLQGPKSLGMVSAVVAPLPGILLVALFILAMTLPGAGDGVAQYVQPDWDSLGRVEVWQAAASQIFFSVTLAVGVMPAYASYLDRKSDIVTDNLIIALANSGVSLFSGFVVFGILGHMAQERGVPFQCVTQSGPGLAFVVFPEALALMPAPQLWSIAFFGMLSLLGLASAFSLLEAVRTTLCDAFPQVHSAIIAGALCVGGFLVGLAYVSDVGVHVVDIVDHFSASYLLILGGLGEALAIGFTRVRGKLLDRENKAAAAASSSSKGGDGEDDDDDDNSSSESSASSDSGAASASAAAAAAAGGHDLHATGQSGTHMCGCGCALACTRHMVAAERRLSGHEQEHVVVVEYLRQKLNRRSSLHVPLAWNWLLRVVIPLVLVIMLVTAAANGSQTVDDLPPQFAAAGWTMVVVSLLASALPLCLTRHGAPGARDDEQELDDEEEQDTGDDSTSSSSSSSSSPSSSAEPRTRHHRRHSRRRRHRRRAREDDDVHEEVDLGTSDDASDGEDSDDV